MPGAGRRLPSALPAACIAATALVLADQLAEGWHGPGPIVRAAGLGLLLGLALGVPMEGAFRLLVRVRPVVAAGLWTAAGLGAGLLVARSLGAFAKLAARQHEQAWLALAVCSAAGVAAGLTVAGVQPSSDRPQGWMGERPAWMRLAFALALLSAAAVLAAVDRVAFVSLYPEAHRALRLAAVGAVWVALIVLRSRSVTTQRGSRAAPLAWAAAAAVALIPAFTLTDDRAVEVGRLLQRPFPALALEAARAVTDVDGDGYSSLFAGGDCAPFDPEVHPGAREIPDNGKDDNCLLGDARALPPAPGDVPVPRTRSPVSVVLITIDSVRPDHMSLYGYGRRTTPALAAWAESAAVFERAYSPGAWTSIAVAATMRGVYARRLRYTPYVETSRARLVPQGAALPPGEEPAQRFGFPVADPRPPLAFWLRRRGMRTVAVVDDGASEMLSPEVGTAEGFDAFHDVDDAAPPNDDASTADLAITALEALDPSRPVFLWAHFFGPHVPNGEHEHHPEWGSGEADGYDRDLAYADRHVARLLDAIEQRPGLPVFTIVTADHGETFYARSRMHGANVGEQNLRVPLVIRGPGIEPRRVPDLVSLVDLFPTVLALTETPAPAGLDGVDLSPVLRGGALPRRTLFADTWVFRHDGAPRADWAAAFDGTHKAMLAFHGNLRWVVDQADLDVLPRNRADELADHAVLRALLAYVEETGGAMRLER